MRAGLFKHRVDFEALRDPASKSPSGATAKKWDSFAKNVPAAVTMIRGSEQFAAAEFNTRRFMKVEIRRTPGINNKMRLIYNSKPYDILTVDDTGFNTWTLECQEGQSQGS